MVVEPAVDMATEEATEPWAVVPWAEPGTSLRRPGRRATLMPTATERGALWWRNRKFDLCFHYLMTVSSCKKSQYAVLIFVFIKPIPSLLLYPPPVGVLPSFHFRDWSLRPSCRASASPTCPTSSSRSSSSRCLCARWPASRSRTPTGRRWCSAACGTATRGRSRMPTTGAAIIRADSVQILCRAKGETLATYTALPHAATAHGLPPLSPH